MAGLDAYLPTDRRRAVAQSVSLPESASGTVLFADVSGFTGLTEALARALGPRRGAEELSVHLNHVYEALIAQVERYQGSVVAFAGDAITCWFAGDDGRRAGTAALAMQAAMESFKDIQLADGETRSLAVKTGVARGPVKRFLVGNAEQQLLDVIAGGTVSRMADAAAVAQRQETVLDTAAVEGLAGEVEIQEWRSGKLPGQAFAVVKGLTREATARAWPTQAPLQDAALRPYLLQPVYDRLRAGQGDFLTELRPSVALFLHFEGVDYDHDPAAGKRLDDYVRWVQQVVGRFGGYLLLVSHGDKGSHLYCAFGAPVAHENSAWRAVAAALELRCPPPALSFVTQTQIGICSGTMRTGAYGSVGRRTYGVLGDDVNLAARLMEKAGAGQVLVSEPVRRATAAAFAWQEFDAIQAKGKTGLISVFALLGPAGNQGSLAEPQYALPMVGRVEELARVGACLDRALAGSGQVVSIIAEAGMGKSRLLAEALRLARERGVAAYVGQCLSHGTNTSYLAWGPVWRGLLGVSGEAPPDAQISALHRRVAALGPGLEPRLPLLGSVLHLAVPENELTAHLDARLRKASLEDLLAECLRRLAREAPAVVVIEDLHWMDALSQELLEALAKAVARSRVLLLVTGRTQSAVSPVAPAYLRLEYHTLVELNAFTDAEARRLIELKLRQLYAFDGAVPPVLLGRLTAKASGNPFYLEELLNYLKDRKIDFEDPDAVRTLELPDSLHSLVLSRVDRLTETQQAALKIASVVGRLFPAAVVWGIQASQAREAVAADLAGLCAADLTALDRPEPELVYIFKHIVIQEVAYESLPQSMRARLHTDIGLRLEELYAATLETQVDLLAFHFDRGTQEEKKRYYLLRAGEAAQANYANQAAISYYERLQPLLAPGDGIPILLKLGKVWELVGDWKKAGACYQQAAEASEAVADRLGLARCQLATADLLRKQGLLTEAGDWLSLARMAFEELGDQPGLGQTLHTSGTVAAMQGDYERSRALYEASLAIRQQLGDTPQSASLYSNLSMVHRFTGNVPEARRLSELSLTLRRQEGDRWAIANSLNNHGVLLRDAGELADARTVLEESLGMSREIGDRWSIANTLTSLAEVTLDQKDWPATAHFLRDSLQTNLDLGDRTAVAFILEYFAAIAAGQGQAAEALRRAGVAAALRSKIGVLLSPAEQARLDQYLAPAREALSAEDQARLFEAGTAMELETVTAALLAQD
jgi:class 3 adenylate cyclase/tetratricopeptide (TPR) repeat protein